MAAIRGAFFASWVSYTLPVVELLYAPLTYLYDNVPLVRAFYSGPFAIAKWILSQLGL